MDAVAYAFSTLCGYSPLTVTQLTSIPTPRYLAGAALIGSTAYIFGGHVTASTITTANEAYDFLTNTWSTVTPFPTTLREMGVGVISSKAYSLGGYNGTSYSNAHYSYDKTTNTWSAVANVPSLVRGGIRCVVYQNKLYAYGGNSSGSQNLHYVYDPTLNSWTSVATTTTMAYGAYCLYNNKFYAVMPSASNGSCKVRIYDPSLNTWDSTTGPDSFDSSDFFSDGTMVHDDEIWILGGNAVHQNWNAIRIYSITRNDWRVEYQYGSPVNAKYQNVIAYNGVCYTFGGQDVSGNVMNNLQKITPPSTKGIKNLQAYLGGM